ncbi:MAG: hypothetical protein R2851_02610 [Caldilineaceae bacterium]
MNLRWSWSISICHVTDPRHLTPAATRRRPCSAALDVNDVPASFVADPTTPARRVLAATRHMFFEVWNDDTEQGERSATRPVAMGGAWRYERMALRMPYHLSYPFVFAREGAHYMVPETPGRRSQSLCGRRFPSLAQAAPAGRGLR